MLDSTGGEHQAERERIYKQYAQEKKAFEKKQAELNKREAALKQREQASVKNLQDLSLSSSASLPSAVGSFPKHSYNPRKRALPERHEVNPLTKQTQDGGKFTFIILLM